MPRVLFCPIMFNLAEVTRAIEVARALPPSLHPVFLGYEETYAQLVRDAGFEVLIREPGLTTAQVAQAMAFDQGRSLRTPFTRELVGRRVAVEREAIRATGAGLSDKRCVRPAVHPQ